MDQLIKELEIHPSDVNAALLCELRLDETLAEDQPNRDMFRGSIAHYLIESHLRNEEAQPLAFIETRLWEEYQYSDFDSAGIAMSQWKGLIAQARVAAVAWLDQVRPWLQLDEDTMLIEVEQSVWLGDFPTKDVVYQVHLFGSPDLVNGSALDHSLRIHDWKTANRMWEVIKTTGQMQPPLYSALVAGAPVPFTFWIWDISKEEWHHLTITPTPGQMESAMKTAIRLAVKREMGLLTANPGVPGYGRTRGWWCSPKYCRNWNKCTARHLTNDGNEDTKRDWREEWQT
jgi:PD-(D/E)XK nuclease superfamily